MADYNESTVAGSKWTRCYRIQIDNKSGAVPTVLFFEEDRIQLEDGTAISKGRGMITALFDSPEKSFPLLDPVTSEPLLTDGEPITMSHGELYVALRSLYLDRAVARDDNASIVGEGASQEE
jgi:hypothetical protein